MNYSTIQNARVLADFLMDAPAGRWTTQAQITEHTGLTGPEVRDACHHFPARFVSSNQGYKHYLRATREEVQICVDNLLRRAEAITWRARKLSRRLRY